MNKFISVIIPNHNKSSTIGKCLEAAFASKYENFEVVVVDDCSTDNSIEIVKRFPCRLIQLKEHGGASKARNTGAKNSRGEVLFFIDADCLLKENTLALVSKAVAGHNGALIGGTYTRTPYEDTFFSTFQSIFVNYSETKKREPDYIATHAMAIDSNLFRKIGGFPEDFLPILEDVEFSHRLRKLGYKLVINPDILVKHIFNFTFIRSLKNAFRKSMYWTMYSMKNRDFFTDSGTASVELKVNVVSFFLNSLLVTLFLYHGSHAFIAATIILTSFNLLVNRGLFRAFLNTKGLLFTSFAVFYYILIYPLAVGAGALSGLLKYILRL